MHALLIVDLQNDFLPGGALAAPRGNAIIPIIDSLLDRYGLVVASKDWHPRATDHFDRWPVHCVRGSAGAEFPPALDPRRIEIVALKGTGTTDDGYSAFEATNLDLAHLLRRAGVEELHVCGLTTEYCVKATALDAARLGFSTTVVADGTAAVAPDSDGEKDAFAEMQEQGVRLIHSTEVER
jgi:nicotinamidase/pyrazinamidase